MPDKVPFPVCALCDIAIEDLYHFVVGCSHEAYDWRDVMSLLPLQDLLPSNLCIWTAPTNFCSLDMLDLNEGILVVLGSLYSTL